MYPILAKNIVLIPVLNNTGADTWYQVCDTDTHDTCNNFPIVLIGEVREYVIRYVL